MAYTTAEGGDSRFALCSFKTPRHPPTPWIAFWVDIKQLSAVWGSLILLGLFQHKHKRHKDCVCFLWNVLLNSVCICHVVLHWLRGLVADQISVGVKPLKLLEFCRFIPPAGLQFIVSYILILLAWGLGEWARRSLRAGTPPINYTVLYEELPLLKEDTIPGDPG